MILLKTPAVLAIAKRSLGEPLTDEDELFLAELDLECVRFAEVFVPAFAKAKAAASTQPSKEPA